MTRILFALLLLTAPLSAQVTNVLFIGNSYTYSNNLPDMLQQLALSGGDSLQHSSSTPGGYTFQLHTQNSTTLNLINQQPWDFVVLQAQSQEPALDTPYVANNVFPYAALLDSLIHANDSCTQTIFFMTWGRKYGDAQNCAAYPPVCTYAGMQAQLRGRYLQMAIDNDAIVGPVGAAWQNVLATNPSFDLYVSDGSHPGVHGSYLAACVFYSTIYRRSPSGLTYYAGLPANEAQLLQNIASTTVLDSLQLWRTETYYPQANFTYVNGAGNSTTCTADSAGIVSCEWSDGVTPGFTPGSAVANFTYATTGTYNICLVVSNGCLTDTICQNVTVGPAGIGEMTADLAMTYDAQRQTLFICTNNVAHVEIVNMTGQIVRAAKISGSSTLQLGDLPPGIYCCTLEREGILFSKKIFIPR